MKVDEIEKRINTAIDYDEYDYQKKARIPLRSNHRAEFVEHVLFTCPKCKSLASLHSKGNNVLCEQCDFNFSIDKYGFFDFPQKGIKFSKMEEWDLWQRDYWKTKLIDHSEMDPILIDQAISLYTSIARQPLKKIGTGTLFLYKNCIEYRLKGKEPLTFLLHNIKGLNVFKQNQLEFYYDRIAYHVKFPGPDVSGYKWMILYQILLEMAEEVQNSAAILS